MGKKNFINNLPSKFVKKFFYVAQKGTRNEHVERFYCVVHTRLV